MFLVFGESPRQPFVVLPPFTVGTPRSLRAQHFFLCTFGVSAPRRGGLSASANSSAGAPVCHRGAGPTMEGRAGGLPPSSRSVTV